MGKEFAAQYPKIASRLALDTTDIPDPYVERLLEGVSFLTAPNLNWMRSILVLSKES